LIGVVVDIADQDDHREDINQQPGKEIKGKDLRFIHN
jgi:hypothetical protein